MMSTNEIAMPLQSAVLEYFAGERQEALLILGGSAILTALAAWLWIATRSSFATAFAATVLATAALLSVTAGSLLVRDKGLVAAIAQDIQSTHQPAVQIELERMRVVVSKYRYYRYAAAVLGAIGLLGLMLSDRAWVHGVAAGLLLLVVAQVLIDNYSEGRAGTYYKQLSQTAVPTLQ